MLGRWKPHSALPGVAERYLEGDGGMLHRQKVQDIEPIVDANARVRNETNGRTPGGGRKVGTVPATLFYAWVNEWTAKGLIGPGHMGDINRLVIERLRDSDYSKFRTTDGGI